MVKREREMEIVVRDHMRDGVGSVSQQNILGSGDMAPHTKLFSKMTIAPGCSIGTHEHVDNVEYYYILSGEGVVTEKDGEKKVGPGDVVITGWGAEHAIRNDSSSPLVFLAVIIYLDK